MLETVFMCSALIWPDDYGPGMKTQQIRGTIGVIATMQSQSVTLELLVELTWNEQVIFLYLPIII